MINSISDFTIARELPLVCVWPRVYADTVCFLCMVFPYQVCEPVMCTPCTTLSNVMMCDGDRTSHVYPLHHSEQWYNV